MWSPQSGLEHTVMLGPLGLQHLLVEPSHQGVAIVPRHCLFPSFGFQQ